VRVETTEAAEVNPSPASIVQAYPCKISAGVAAGHRSWCWFAESTTSSETILRTTKKGHQYILLILSTKLHKKNLFYLYFQSPKFQKHKIQLFKTSDLVDTSLSKPTRYRTSSSSSSARSCISFSLPPGSSHDA
jgi:hypothetical protein